MRRDHSAPFAAHGWQYFPHNARQQPSRKHHDVMDAALRSFFPVADRRRLLYAVDVAEVNATIAASEARGYPPHEKEA